jgi:hypothetical protein
MSNTKPEVVQNQTNLFPLGQIVATPGALEALEVSQQSPAEFLERHAKGDWGELSADDIAENEFSLKNGFRLLSSYCTATNASRHVPRLWRGRRCAQPRCPALDRLKNRYTAPSPADMDSAITLEAMLAPGNDISVGR